MDNIDNYLIESINMVYDMIGNRQMNYYYVPVIEKKFVDSQDFINYDFDGRIKINATINSDLASDVDLEFSKEYLKTTRKSATIQFLLSSISPYIPKPLDRIYIEFADGRTEDWIISGIDNGVLLQGIYISVRAFDFDGALTKFQWANNGVMSDGLLQC